MEISNLFNNAVLAEAAYADLSNVTNEQTYIDALKAKDFSDTQAKDFVNTWRIVAHQPNTLSGFSATLFQNIHTGEYVFANRGTEPSILDFAEDIFGIAYQRSKGVRFN